MTANVTFSFSNQQAAGSRLVVPAKAVGEDGNGRFVFLIEESAQSATVRKQPVQVGALSLDGFEIVSGLTEGQKIATAGLQTLINGQQVSLQ